MTASGSFGAQWPRVSAFYEGQPLCSVSRQLTGVPRRPRQPVLAEAGQNAGGNGSTRARPRRHQVTFISPRAPEPLTMANFGQGDLNRFLDKLGAIGFAVAGGRFSQCLDELPEGGEVQLVLPPEPDITTQVKNLQGAMDNVSRGNELRLEFFLRDVARDEDPRATITALPTTPFKGANQQDYIQLDAAIRTGTTLFLGEHKQVLNEDAVDNLLLKLARIRRALAGGAKGRCPALATALVGVTRIKLYLAGEAVEAGLSVDDIVGIAAPAGISVLLPCDRALCLAPGAAPAPAMPLDLV